ncbi:hypothetical protein PISMIDRAFT_18618 [Pisolithus microcarpus 441]|uniref:Uncharacterized protein n=1 Tax=Pisolithus microcarpus 441 TaxID=765257 RepID=A0A0C9Y6Q7_9AGAM|nr:hypothetical protein PISMIDRAFT_18618 [Pisolithus microcarpus 441]
MAKSDITHLLSKDSKLNATKRQCHLTNNLCLFCVKGGHSTKDHLKSTSHAAKACTAVAEALPAPPAEKADKAKATELPPHHGFNPKIDIKEGTSPPISTIYSLLPPELEALCTFIDKHLSYGFIKQSTSAHSAPVLFVKKKDGSLCLCVDY